MKERFIDYSQAYKMVKTNNYKESLFINDFIAGGTSGIIAKTISAPIDRIKLLLQTQYINKDINHLYKNPYDCIKRTYQEQGIISFWRGNLANVYRYFPSQALNFACKDSYKSMLGKIFAFEKKDKNHYQYVNETHFNYFRYL